MREAVGNTFIVGIIITFVIVFIVLFATSTSYTKAYKIKNRMIDIIESNGGVTAQTYTEIDEFLGSIGYRVNVSGQSCPTRHQGTLVNGGRSSGYRYCIYEFGSSGTNENRGSYYGVTAYMYFDVPVLSTLLEMPVYGETKFLNVLSN